MFVAHNFEFSVVHLPEKSSSYSVNLTDMLFSFLSNTGSIADWSAVYLTSDLKADALECTLGYVGFELLVAVGRLYSDYLVVRIGRQRLLQLAGK